MSWVKVKYPPRQPVWVEATLFTAAYVAPNAEVIAEVEFIVDHDSRRNYQLVRMDGQEDMEFDSLEEAKNYVEATYALS